MTERKLPSLNALRAFAVVGTHLNLKAAANALFVTPSALSHQIRGLEESLNTKLFIRTNSGLQLTTAAESILPAIQQAFDLLADSVAQLQLKPEQQTLTVSMLSTFAMRWFIPRLYRFQQQHPDIEVRISTTVEPVDFSAGDYDCAIRSGHGLWPGLYVEKLFSEQLTPVCSPGLQIGAIDDLAQHTWLHARLRPDDWRIWLGSADAVDVKPAHQQTFETRNFTIQAAIDGLGVAVIDSALVKDELQSGRLVQPFAQALPITSAYHLVWPESRSVSLELEAFRRWLAREVVSGS